MIVDSLFVEEDRLICVVATSKLTDEDRDSLVHLYGEDNIEYVSVRYPGAKKSRKLVNYACGAAVIEATFSADGSSKVPAKISVDDLDQFCRQFPGVWFDCIDATARAFDEVSPSMDEDFFGYDVRCWNHDGCYRSFLGGALSDTAYAEVGMQSYRTEVVR